MATLRAKIPLKQSDLGQDVDIVVDRNRLGIQPIPNPREGWDEAFRTLAQQGLDQILDEDLTGRTSWDEDRWEWPEDPAWRRQSMTC